MENRMLLLRRMIYFVSFLLSLVFISFYGGKLPYMLFFMIVINSVTSVLYILYVYATIKVYQEISGRQVEKHETVAYGLVLNNESLMAYRDIKLNFMHELSEVAVEDIGRVGMEPGQGLKQKGELRCKYSGTYYVGIDSIEIMDYFKILRIRFPMPQKLKVTVSPRVLEPGKFALFEKKEAFDSSHRGKSEYELDNEVRKYYPGDNKRWIHWRNSARRGQLMVRTHASEEKLEFVIIMDGSVQKTSFSERIVSCDKIREVVLALVHYLYCGGYRTRVFLGEVYEKEVCSRRDFQDCYHRVTDCTFADDFCVTHILQKIAEEGEQVPVVYVTSAYLEKESKISERWQQELMVSVIDVDAYESVEEILQVKET